MKNNSLTYSDTYSEIIDETGKEPDIDSSQKSKVFEIYNILSGIKVSECKTILNFAVKNIDINSKLI